jgi:hypothetical protein
VNVVRAVELDVLSGSEVVTAERDTAMTGRHGRFLGHETGGADEMRRAIREETGLGQRASSSRLPTRFTATRRSRARRSSPSRKHA